MARKAWVMLAVVTGGLTLSVVSASLSNSQAVATAATIKPDDIDRLHQLIDGTKADVATIRQRLGGEVAAGAQRWDDDAPVSTKLRLIELEVESLQGDLRRLDRELDLQLGGRSED